MITGQSHSCVWVLDQDVAYDFYVTKLGLEVRTDFTMEGGFRWLTVGAAAQPDLEIALMPVDLAPTLDEATKVQLRELVAKGAMGCGVLAVDDCRETYKDLLAKGVEFRGEPVEQFYGIEAILVDPFGNWFSMTQRKFA